MNLTDEIAEQDLISQIIVSLSIPRKIVEKTVAELITAKWLMMQQDGKLILNPELLKVQEEIKHVDSNVKLQVEYFLKNGISDKDRIISDMYDQIQQQLKQLNERTQQEVYNFEANEQHLKLVDENKSLKVCVEELKQRIEAKENKELVELKELYDQQIVEKDKEITALNNRIAQIKVTEE